MWSDYPHSSTVMTWQLAKSLFIFLFLFITTRWSTGKYHMTLSQCHNWCDRGSQMVAVTVGHMMRVTWGPWESKHIATVVKCISSREMSKNSIEFFLSNSKQRDSWLNSSRRTLDADKYCQWANSWARTKPTALYQCLIKRTW